jgi:hypothetical protein
MEQLVKHVVGEMGVIAHAPVTIVAALLIMGGAIWWAMDWRYSGIIVNRDAEISSLRTQRDEYREKLSGATPDQAAHKIRDLNGQVEALQKKEAEIRAKEWPTLSSGQITEWASKLSQTPVGFLAVFFSDQYSEGLRGNLYEVFRRASWPNPTVLNAGHGIGLMIKARKDEPAALTLIALFNGWGYAVKHDTEGENTPGKLQFYIWTKP